MKKIRRINEPDAIAEFLKNEFYRDEFHHDRENFEPVVMHADIANESENALRRALLFRRRGHMWRELPVDTQWWEVSMEPADLRLLRVFPRAQWRRIAAGNFLLENIVERIRNQKFSGPTRGFISKVQALSYRLRTDKARTCVLLIGVDEGLPFTILEGNHRLTAALLADGVLLPDRFRVLCGFSARMSESCWYETNLANLWRYAKNRMRNLLYDKDADIERVLKDTHNEFAADPLEGTLSGRKAVPGSK
jgi:hypothetical protein